MIQAGILHLIMGCDAHTRTEQARQLLDEGAKLKPTCIPSLIAVVIMDFGLRLGKTPAATRTDFTEYY